jgi:hypothetical protein
MGLCHADSKVIARITVESGRTTKLSRVGRRHVRAAEEPQQVDEGEYVLVVEQLVAFVTGDPFHKRTMAGAVCLGVGGRK